jgi:glycosyltransferase involved in cell wall biosynthesis
MTAYNEQAVIADTICDCLTVLDQIPGHHEILVVNDGSTDRTGEILSDLAMNYSQIRILVHPENRGIAQAQRWLIHEAKGSLIFHIAADGEWRASELHRMLHQLNEGYDIVIGVRRKRHYSVYRKIVSWMYNMLVLVLFRRNFHDIGSIRLVRAALWKRIPSESNSAFFIAEKLLLAHRNGCRIGFIGVDHVWRSSGRSKFNNPLRALDAFVELLAFRLSIRSRLKINLWGEGAARGAADRSNASVKLPPGGDCGQRAGDTAQ